MKKRLLYCFGILLFIACGAQNADKHDAEKMQENIFKDFPSQQMLFENYMQQKRVLIVCSDSDVVIYNAMQQFLERIKENRDEFKFELKRSSEVIASDLENTPLYMIGAFADINAFTKIDQNLLPFKFDGSHFEFDNKRFEDSTDIIKMSFYPSPFNKQLPITIITGNSTTAIEAYVNEITKNARGYFFWENWGYQIYRNSKRIVLGNFSSDSLTQWQLDKKEHWEFDYTGKIIRDDDKIQFIDHNTGLSKAEMDSVINMVVTNLGQTEFECGGVIKEKIKYHIYPSTEIKGLMLNNTDQVHVNFETQEVHAAINKEFKNMYPATEAQLVVRQLLGKPKVDALEPGVALLGKNKWGGTGYAYWAKKLNDARLF
ncbi:MAG: hypothetical protein H7Y00_10935, partial [Fimbriimonadaceae bacterium]|nr:hypothetical protein [Chitinophagales bacterium]